jgi:hypothetical protein
MRIFTAGAAVFLGLLCGTPAMAQDALGSHEDCFQMKQRVISVSDERVALLDNAGTPTGIKTNASGDTARDDEAKKDIVAGDQACENNDLASARDYYQRAIDAMTSR